MGAWYCQVVLIETIEKHPNADNLSIATVDGAHPVIIKTGEYEVGQSVGYICIDTVLPATDQFHFMSPVVRDTDAKILGYKYQADQVPERYRIVKAKKIRGVLSMGLIVPSPEGLNVGDSIVDRLGLTKWEEPEDQDEIAHNNPKVRTRTDKKPVGWNIPFYDINSARKYSNLFLPDEEIVLLEKDHGCNASFCFDGDKLWKKSRNFFKADDVTFVDGEGISQTVLSTDHWSEAARRFNLREKLAPFPMKVFFAECVGQVKGFRYDSEVVDGQLQTKLHFYDVYDPIAGRYVDYDESLALIRAAGLTPSKELYRGVWKSREEMYAFAEGKSSWNDKHIREGWVMKSTKERFEPKLGGRFQLKLVSEGYNLQK